MSWGLGEDLEVEDWDGWDAKLPLFTEDPRIVEVLIVVRCWWSDSSVVAAANIDAPATAEVPPALTGLASNGLAWAAATDISAPLTLLTFVFPVKANFFFGSNTVRFTSILCLASAMVAVHCLRSYDGRK